MWTSVVLGKVFVGWNNAKKGHCSNLENVGLKILSGN